MTFSEGGGFSHIASTKWYLSQRYIYPPWPESTSSVIRWKVKPYCSLTLHRLRSLTQIILLRPLLRQSCVYALFIVSASICNNALRYTLKTPVRPSPFLRSSSITSQAAAGHRFQPWRCMVSPSPSPAEFRGYRSINSTLLCS